MKRSLRKKLHRQFKVGDVVTWGTEFVSHKIVEVRDTGVVVDAHSQNCGLLFVSFDKNNRNPSGRGPIKHSTAEPDKVTKPINK